jgi:hypothetical protein
MSRCRDDGTDSCDSLRAGTPTNRAVDEHDRIAWFAPEELTSLALVDESYRPLLARAVESQSA